MLRSVSLVCAAMGMRCGPSVSMMLGADRLPMLCSAMYCKTIASVSGGEVRAQLGDGSEILATPLLASATTAQMRRTS
jgi:hypothetical protein